MADNQGQTVEYQWAYSIMDSSRVSTFVISMLLIVYGSFRSLNMEQEAREKAHGSTNCLLNPSQSVSPENNVQTLDTMHALCLPLGASISLLVMFFFFDSMQMLFAICTAINEAKISAKPDNVTIKKDSKSQIKNAVLNIDHMKVPESSNTSVKMSDTFLRQIPCTSKAMTMIDETQLEKSGIVNSCQELVRDEQQTSTEAFSVIATVALAFLLLPMCQYIIRPCSDGNKISFGVCGRFTAAELLSFSLSVFIVCIWVLTGHWLLMDAMGMGLCVAFIAFVRLPSLKVSTLLLTGLLIYDVFWVFFSSYIFSANVMVKVATRPAENPVGLVARKLHIGGVAKEAPKLSLPGKLVFPSIHNSGHFSMLGLGDIVMPGLLLCFVLRYDAYKKSQGLAPPGSRVTYFHCSLLGYFLGLLTATVSSEIFKAAQPALLYLVPFTLLPLLTMAYLKGDLRRMWSEPFKSLSVSKHLQDV